MHPFFAFADYAYFYSIVCKFFLIRKLQPRNNHIWIKGIRFFVNKGFG